MRPADASTERSERQAVAQWTPTLAGIVIASYGLLRRNKMGLALAAGGILLAARNQPAMRSLSGRSGEMLRTVTSSLLSRDDDERQTLSGAMPVSLSRAEAFEFWRNPEKRNRFMGYERPKDPDQGLLSKAANLIIAAKAHDWKTELVDEEPQRRLHFRVSNDSTMTVEFEDLPGGRGTAVRATVEEPVPDGLASLFSGIRRRGDELKLQALMRHFKQVAEAGEVPTIHGQPVGPKDP